ncbi:MAG: LAGLIDADG family homing endonuclease [Candidatus Omnitrophica bacterium]|jgi:intein/homing endonuclease|nr:hypothetical protein [Candidatus Omnitrophota bacterium]MDD5079941.1 LAGLIDADG family homing endonuclease [Candidatus Omnitrophota bacterium]
MKITPQAAGRLGALKRKSLYGNFGTEEGRRKGGLVSYYRFKSNPELVLRKGFKLDKNIAIPDKTPSLAEFIGIILGDGSISDYQVRVYFNAKTDRPYANFVKDATLRLFNIDSKIAVRLKNTLELVISSKRLVKFLLDLGLKKGNKIAQQVDIPAWIFDKIEYSSACLRGLIDTDGGVYFHTHTTKGIKYRNMVLCFTSRSKPLLNSVDRMFSTIGIESKNDLLERIHVYNRVDIKKYMDIIGSHNQNLINRFESYKGTRA